MQVPDANLYLVGFMGTGKTTVGRMVAERLGFSLLDSDQEIERQQGRTIAAIFADAGEPAFRALEREFIARGHPATRTVVACGGGLVVQPGMLELLKQKGVVICLHASLATVLQRISGHAHRPLFNVENPEARLRELYAQREPVYRRSGTLILTDNRPLAEVVNHVFRTYRREAEEFARASARAAGK
ncbi:MAG TPA: shikimate kinase [Opitutaceae bacterium]|nr:shikimate kinase [Opitutaceae bacterium]